MMISTKLKKIQDTDHVILLLCCFNVLTLFHVWDHNWFNFLMFWCILSMTSNMIWKIWYFFIFFHLFWFIVTMSQLSSVHCAKLSPESYKKIISYFKKSLKRFSILFKRHCRNLKKPFVRNRVTEKHSILFLLYWIWHSDSNNTRNILFHMKQRCRIWFDIALNHTTRNCRT